MAALEGGPGAYESLCAELQAVPARWLVTGVAGFIGSNLLEALLRLDQTVVGLDNFATGHRANLDEVRRLVSPAQWQRFTFIEGDICSTNTCREACEGVGHVLHQAALGSVPRSLADPLATNAANIDGFLNMLVAARDAKVKSFVYAASSSTYGDHPGLPKREDVIGNPLSPYAVTKLVDELYADVFARSYGFSTSGLRYFNVFGKRQDPSGAYAAVIPRWIASMIAGEEIHIHGDGSTSRDFCFVNNVVQANLLAARRQKAATSRIYNVAVGGRTSLNALFGEIVDVLAGHGVFYGLPPKHGAFRAGDVRHSQADISRAAAELGYAPRFELRRGLEAAMPWYISQLTPASAIDAPERSAARATAGAGPLNPPASSKPGATAARQSIEHLKDWCIRHALPFWGTVGYDRQLESFHEKTTFDGSPIAASPRRTMVQCRQIYTFAHAARLGWYPEGADIAIRATESLITRHWRGDGRDGFVFSVDPAGSPYDVKRDAYAHAFGAFALAHVYRVRPDHRYKAIADETFFISDTMLAAPNYGGVIDSVPRSDALRRQNPHMHLFEACLAWYEATGEAPYLARAAELFGLFATRFFHAKEGALGEFFDDEWAPTEGRMGRLCQPGHHFEWVWLLRRYEVATGRPVGRYANALFDHARRWGVDQNLTVVEEIDMDGNPSRPSSRCWQQAEALKAAVAQHESRVPGMPAFASQAAKVLMDRFLGTPFAAGWIDNIEADSTPKLDFVPASTLYHVMLAAAEADRVLGGS